MQRELRTVFDELKVVVILGSNVVHRFTIKSQIAKDFVEVFGARILYGFYSFYIYCIHTIRVITDARVEETKNELLFSNITLKVASDS